MTPARLLPTLLLALLLPGCATHEFVLSGTLEPVIAGGAGTGPVTLFRARVDKGVLQVWGRVRWADGEYRPDFATEIDTATAWCMALAASDVTFREDWARLTLQVTHEYGSQSRWKNTLGYTEVKLSREALQDLGRRHATAAEYAARWTVFAYKVGPPDYQYLYWPPGGD